MVNTVLIVQKKKKTFVESVYILSKKNITFGKLKQFLNCQSIVVKLLSRAKTKILNLQVNVRNFGGVLP